LSIDDFGICYSSLTRRAQLPCSELEVGRSSVAAAREAPESRRIVAALIGLARSLGLRATAEGVEDEWTLKLLRELGCHSAQGYFIAQPMCACEISSWLKKAPKAF